MPSHADYPNYPNSMNYYVPPKAASNTAPQGTANGGLGNCNVSPNTKDPNSVNNPFSACGSPYAANSVKNPIQCPLGKNCPNNPFYNSKLPSTAPQANPTINNKTVSVPHAPLNNGPTQTEIKDTEILPTNPPQTNPF